MAPRSKKHNTKSDDRNKVFKQRFPNFKKKAIELSVLCGNSVGFVCYGPDKDLYVWPEEPESLSQLFTKYNELNDEKRKKNGSDVYDFPDLKGLSVEELKNHISIIDSHLDGIEKKKIRIVRKRFNCDHDDSEITPRVSEGNKASEVEIQTEMPRVLETDEKLEQPKYVSNDQSNRLGAFDELSYVVRGFTGRVSGSHVLAVSNSTGLDETICGSDVLAVYDSRYDQVTYDSGMDTDQLYGDLDSLLSNTTDNWGLEFPLGQEQVFVDVDTLLSNTDNWSFEPLPLDFAAL